MMKIVKKLLGIFRISASTVMELVRSVSIAFGIGYFSIPISAIVCGVLLIIAGGLAA